MFCFHLGESGFRVLSSVEAFDIAPILDVPVLLLQAPAHRAARSAERPGSGDTGKKLKF